MTSLPPRRPYTTSIGRRFTPSGRTADQRMPGVKLRAEEQLLGAFTMPAPARFFTLVAMGTPHFSVTPGTFMQARQGSIMIQGRKGVLRVAMQACIISFVMPSTGISVKEVTLPLFWADFPSPKAHCWGDTPCRRNHAGGETM